MREIDRFRLTSADYAGGQCVARHTHQHASLTLAIAGSFVEAFDALFWQNTRPYPHEDLREQPSR